MESKLRYLSGVQPSGSPHVGNYFGAIKQFVDSQNAGHETFVFVADWHSLTSINNPQELRNNIEEVVATYLACGLDPEKITLYQQSQIRGIQELSWILACLTNVSLLHNGHAYKDKVDKGIMANAGLLTYPVLMAADILGVKANKVPVGKDQKQHLEITRDLAGRFNHVYGKTLTIPEAQILEETAIIRGTNGQKMGKSAKNTIDLFAPEKKLKKQVGSIVTKPISLGDSLPWEDCTITSLYSLMANESEIDDLKSKYQSGEIGYGHAKQILFNRLMEFFEPTRKLFSEIIKNKQYLKEVLEQGRNKAEEVVNITVDEVREKVGLKIY